MHSNLQGTTQPSPIEVVRRRETPRPVRSRRGCLPSPSEEALFRYRASAMYRLMAQQRRAAKARGGERELCLMAEVRGACRTRMLKTKCSTMRQQMPTTRHALFRSCPASPQPRNGARVHQRQAMLALLRCRQNRYAAHAPYRTRRRHDNGKICWRSRR